MMLPQSAFHPAIEVISKLLQIVTFRLIEMYKNLSAAFSQHLGHAVFCMDRTQ